MNCHHSAIRDSSVGLPKVRMRRSSMKALLPTFIGLVMINTAFLDTARCLRCQHTTHTEQHQRYWKPWIISGKSKLHSTTLKSTSEESIAESLISPQSITPKGTPVQKYGTPVGAVILPGSYIEAFHKECRKAFPEVKNLQFRGVEKYHEPAASQRNEGEATVAYKAIHVQTEVAASLLDGNAPSLIEFIRSKGGHFLPGIRMKRKERKEHWDQQRNQLPSKSHARFTFVELFAGVGGFRMGLEPIGGSCVLASERDEVACAFYRRHFGSQNKMEDCCSELIQGDVLDIVASDFPSTGFDLLTAGFPCQPFSARGKKKGLDDDGHRGQMYQELVRILMEEKPSFFLFENVVGLVTMDGGRRVVQHDEISNNNNNHRHDHDHSFEAGKTMEIVLEAFRSCGYKVEWHVVNCKHFCPQHRERVYFVGSLLELNCPDVVWENIYPKEQNDEATKMPLPLLRDFLEPDHSNCTYVQGCELTEQQWDMVQRKSGAESKEKALAKLGLKIDEPSAPTLISSYKTPASVSARFVTEEADGTLRHGSPLRPRFLTPKEFRSIMGFPETFEVTSPMEFAKRSREEGDGMVDGHVYKVLGNAVVPSVIEAIGREILRLMEEVEIKQTKVQETSS